MVLISSCGPFLPIGEFIDSLRGGEVVNVQVERTFFGGRLNGAYWGEILSTASMMRGAAGAILECATRDSAAVEETGFPVYAQGYAPNDMPCLPVKFDYREPEYAVADGDGAVFVSFSQWPDLKCEAERLNEAERLAIAALCGGESLQDVMIRTGTG
jgi:regulator of RNase E activity RraA